MPRGNLDKRKILEAAGALANEISIRKLNLKQLAQKLDIQPPSLYNHVQSLDHLRLDLMAYGWEQVGERIAETLIGISGDEAIRRACEVFYDYAEENPGIFEAMAYYNRDADKQKDGAPDRLTDILFKLCPFCRCNCRFVCRKYFYFGNRTGCLDVKIEINIAYKISSNKSN